MIALEVAHNASLFECDTCTWGRHCDESRPAPIVQWVVHGVIESKTCLLPMITPSSRFLLQMFEHYRNKLLPVEGGILEQPHYYAEAMEVLNRRNTQIEAEQLEKRARELRQQHHRMH